MKKIISAISAASIIATCMSGMFFTTAYAEDMLYVLSGNTFTDDDITAYEGVGKTLNLLTQRLYIHGPQILMNR